MLNIIDEFILNKKLILYLGGHIWDENEKNEFEKNNLSDRQAGKINLKEGYEWMI